MKKLLFLGLFFAASCSLKPTYYQTQKGVMDFYYQKQYAQALAAIDKNEYIREDFNENLYRVEKAKLFYDNRQFDEASTLLIATSVDIEGWSTFYVRNLTGNKVYLHNSTRTIYGKPRQPRPGDTNQTPQPRVLAEVSSNGYESIPTFKSPNKTKYVCTHFERPFISYYIGLSGMHIDENITFVEARRLNLLYDRINTRKAPFTNVPFSPNPFIQLCAGMFYEATGNLNAAFIAYEQSLTDFENPYCQVNYGLSPPEQLKQDLISISKQLEFEDKHRKYVTRFSPISIDTSATQAGIIFLIDVNHAPRKQMVLRKVVDSTRNYPITYSYPYIESVSEPITELMIEIENKEFHAEMIHNTQYMLMDVSEKNIRKDFARVDLNAINQRRENYDTRNWQTLPAQVFYSRVNVANTSSLNTVMKYKVGSEWKFKEVEIKNPSAKRIIHVQLVD